MNWLSNLLIVVQVLSALGVILLVLLQHGKGADMGAAFGGGASGSLFGATGSANFLSRFTAALAVVFFASTLVLAMFGHRRPEAPTSVMEGAPPVTAPVPAPSDVPATDVPTPAPDASSNAASGASSDAAVPPSQPASSRSDFGTNDIPK